MNAVLDPLNAALPKAALVLINDTHVLIQNSIHPRKVTVRSLV
jgi:hypothetical protein